MLAISHVMDKIRGGQDIGQKKHWRITRSVTVLTGGGTVTY